jgi:hypothetical protein
LVVGAGCLVLLGTSGCGSDQDHVLGVGAQRPAVAQARLASVGPVVDASTRKVTVDTYATAVCTGLAQFGVDFHAAKAHRAAAMTGTATATRSALLGYYDALDAAFAKMVASTRAAGIPNLSEGKAVAAGVVSTLDAARQAGDHYRPKAQALGVSDAKELRTAALMIAVSSDRDVAGVMRRLSRYDGDPMFRNAFTRAITCQHR